MELIRTRFPNGVILNHDCFDIMPKLSDKGIDLILCDLPYGTTQNRWDSVLDLENFREVATNNTQINNQSTKKQLLEK